MTTIQLISLMLTATVLLLSVIIAVMMWQARKHNNLLERRWDVYERENRKADELMQKKSRDDEPLKRQKAL
ncbi:MAG: hypothetical protein K5928_03705 [Prevotella sp.]|nr:hypothetical protein [Prevotella sp.]